MFRVLILAFLLIASTAQAKHWNGSAWVDTAAKRYNGSAWVDVTEWRYNGSTWDQINVPPGGSTTATSACAVIGADSSGSLELLVYNSSGTLLAKTSPMEATSSTTICGNLDTSVSSTDGDLKLAVRETTGTGYPQLRFSSGDSNTIYLDVDIVSTPSTLPTGISYGEPIGSFAIWLRDSGNTQVLGISTSIVSGPINPNMLIWRGAAYAW